MLNDSLGFQRVLVNEVTLVRMEVPVMLSIITEIRTQGIPVFVSKALLAITVS